MLSGSMGSRNRNCQVPATACWGLVFIIQWIEWRSMFTPSMLWREQKIRFPRLCWRRALSLSWHLPSFTEVVVHFSHPLGNHSIKKLSQRSVDRSEVGIRTAISLWRNDIKPVSVCFPKSNFDNWKSRLITIQFSFLRSTNDFVDNDVVVSLCLSRVEFARPRRLLNVDRQWRVIVNDGHNLQQSVRLETCLKVFISL